MVRRPSLLAILILVLGSMKSVTAAVEYPMISSLLERAQQSRLRGDFISAESLLSRAQRIAPRSADVYIELAHLRKDQGDYGELREIVDYGAQISDGPEISVAKLKLLKNKLSVLLPLDAATPFALPPLDLKEKHVSLAMERNSNTAIVAKLSDEDQNKIDPESSRNKSKPSKITDELKHLSKSQIESHASDYSGGLNSEMIIKESTEANKVNSSVIRNMKDGTKPLRWGFQGAGILATTSSGTWISRGKIELDY